MRWRLGWKRGAGTAALALSAWLVACGAAPRAGLHGAWAPEAATATQHKPGWHFERQAVAAAHPLAVQAGVQVLRDGGSAMDAAVAVQMVLGVVEPQSSGIGGGAFLLHWDGAQVQAFDGRETAPAAADETLFLSADGRPLPFMQAVVGGRAVGVPGAVRMLEMAQHRHGRLPWARLLQPAIDLAEQGFPLGARLHALLRTDPALRRDPLAAALYYQADGQPQAVGATLRNPALAQVLRALARDGARALHEGPVARDMVQRVRRHAGNPGRLSEADLAAYRPLQRAPLCTEWRARWRVCGMPPPSSGHLALMQILGLLEALPVPHSAWSGPVPDADALHFYSEAARLAYADRALYVADPEFVAAPGGDWKHLLAPSYLRQRALRVGPRSLGEAEPGVPAVLRAVAGSQRAQPEGGTSHVSIVDAQGHAVALTSSIESAFGARLMSDGGSGLPGGFLLNNQLTDFSFLPADAAGRPIANRVQAGKRPRSSMSPTLVFDLHSGELVMSLGSPGGAPIVHYVAKTLLVTLLGGQNLQGAANAPNFGSLNGPTLLEAGRFPSATLRALRERGHAVVETELTSGVHALQRTASGWFGAADPRREGVVGGD